MKIKKQLQSIRTNLQDLLAQVQSEIDNYETPEEQEEGENPWQECFDYLENADSVLEDAEKSVPAE